MSAGPHREAPLTTLVIWPGANLIAAARCGDVEALTAVVYGAHPHVHRFARTLCATPQDAEDTAQEALIIPYRKIGMLRASGALVSWMFRIVRNECIRRARPVFPCGPAVWSRSGSGSHEGPGRYESSDGYDATGATVRSAEEDVLLRLDSRGGRSGPRQTPGLRRHHRPPAPWPAAGWVSARAGCPWAAA